MLSTFSTTVVVDAVGADVLHVLEQGTDGSDDLVPVVRITAVDRRRPLDVGVSHRGIR